MDEDTNNKDKSETVELPGVLIPEEQDTVEEVHDSDDESFVSSDEDQDEENKNKNEDTKVTTTQQLEIDLMYNPDDKLEKINKIDNKINTKIEAYEEKMDAESPERPPPGRSTRSRTTTDRFTPSMDNKRYPDEEDEYEDFPQSLHESTVW